MPSVTTTIENLELEGPILEVHFLISSDLENKYRIANIPIPEPVIVKALVDTGASSCIIQSKIPTDLKLEPIGKITINTPSSTNHECYQYYMRMVIPSTGLVYEGVFIAAALEGQNISSLIGRDLLNNGIFIYIGYANQFTLSLL